jgi:hypothetical protein
MLSSQVSHLASCRNRTSLFACKPARRGAAGTSDLAAPPTRFFARLNGFTLHKIVPGDWDLPATQQQARISRNRNWPGSAFERLHHAERDLSPISAQRKDANRLALVRASRCR